MFDADMQPYIDALPTYIDREVLAQILSRIGGSLDDKVGLLQDLIKDLPTEGPGAATDFNVEFRVPGNEELTSLFNHLIKRPSGPVLLTHASAGSLPRAEAPR